MASSSYWPTGGGSDPTVNFQQAYYNENPEVAYRAWLNQQPGLGIGLDPRSRFYQQQYGRQYQNFQTTLGQPGAPTTFTDYLGQQGKQLDSLYTAQAPEARGLDYSNYLGRTRYLF